MTQLTMYFAVNVSDGSPNGDEYHIQTHMFRPTIIDMQDKYCGNCYDIYLIQFQYTKVAALFKRTMKFRVDPAPSIWSGDKLIS